MSNEVKDFFSTYSDFVTKVTSEPSLEMDALKNSLDDINNNSKVLINRCRPMIKRKMCTIYRKCQNNANKYLWRRY